MNKRITLLPKSGLGMWSISLALSYIALFLLSELILGPGPDYNIGLAVALSAVAAGIAAAALVTGLVSIVKSKEGSVLVFVAAFVGLYCAFGTTVSLLRLAVE